MERTEKDSLGEVKIPSDKLWGPSTQRALTNFKIGTEPMPLKVIHTFGLQKLAAVQANLKLGLINQNKANAIAQAAQEVADGKLDEHFPLGIWQTGSGTKTHINVNEVIARRASEILGEDYGIIHPNDDVNLGQSTNDSFPTVMHMATVLETQGALLPALGRLEKALEEKCKAFEGIIKIGRTHLQDATPLTLGQEFSAFKTQVEFGIRRIQEGIKPLYALAQGGTAVGTGLNTHADFAETFVAMLNAITRHPFRSAPNKFEALATHDAMVEFSGVLNTLSVSLMKIANDIRFLASGPRCGISEILLPANGAGSSIMPGKVNPSQVEALTMVCAQVMGNHVAVTIAATHGHLQLNAFKPLIIHNTLQSIRLLSDAIVSFTDHCVMHLDPNLSRIQENLERSLMLATALNPQIGYDKATQVVKKARMENTTLKEATVSLGFATAQQFDQWVKIKDMIHPGLKEE